MRKIIIIILGLCAVGCAYQKEVKKEYDIADFLTGKMVYGEEQQRYRSSMRELKRDEEQTYTYTCAVVRAEQP